MDADTTTKQVAEVLNNAVDEASSLGESAFVILLIIAGMILLMIFNGKQSSQDRKETRELDREHKETIAKSHDRTSEAICKLAESDARSVDCQIRTEQRLAAMEERGIVFETVADECLAIAEDHVGSESISAEISRIRKRLERRRG